MDVEPFVRQRVSRYYWKDDVNCATTTLKTLSEYFGVALNGQIFDAAIGMHGAGKYGAQCGLVEGVLMFLGLFGRDRQIPDRAIVDACREFAGQFEKKFGDLQCSILRPTGFRSDDPPHLCEALTYQTIIFDIDFVKTLGWETS
jgi:C_GCAxxG_C_C family probable redox protein